jgi:CBS domain-containing protein
MNTTKDLMHVGVHYISPQDSLMNAYLTMNAKGIRHLPVINSDDKLVGILSDRDVSRAMVTKVISEFQQEVSLPSQLKVNEFMSWPVFTATENTQLKTITEIMIKEKISAVVIENDHGQVSGIVTTNDLLAYLCQLMGQNESKEKWTQWTLSYYLNQNKHR